MNLQPSEITKLLKSQRYGHISLFFDIKIFPKAEALESSSVLSSAFNASSAVLKFDKALSLFNYKQTNPQGDWREIAARDGMWRIYNLKEYMEYFSQELNACPTLKKLIDFDKIRDAKRLHKKYFPNSELFRNALAHIPELTKSQKYSDKNACKGPFQSDSMIIPDETTKVFVSASFLGNTFQVTAKGTLLKCEMTEETLQRMVEIKEAFYSGLEGIMTAPIHPDHK